MFPSLRIFYLDGAGGRTSYSDEFLRGGCFKILFFIFYYLAVFSKMSL